MGSHWAPREMPLKPKQTPQCSQEVDLHSWPFGRIQSCAGSGVASPFKESTGNCLPNVSADNHLTVVSRAVSLLHARAYSPPAKREDRTDNVHIESH
jgi:hypothetical protein